MNRHSSFNREPLTPPLSGADPALVASQSSQRVVSTKGFDPGDMVELIVSGVVTRVCGIDDSDGTFMDETGAWHSFDDAVLA